MLDVIWAPEPDEVEDICNSRAAKAAYDMRTPLFYSTIRAGQKLRLAFLQAGGQAEVESVQLVCAGSEADLREILLR